MVEDTPHCEFVATGGRTDWRKAPSRELEKLLASGTGGRNDPRLLGKSIPEHTTPSSVPLFVTKVKDNVIDDIEDSKPTTPGKEGEHIIIPYASFVGFVESFGCRSCRLKVQGLNQTTIGIATRISYSCACGKESVIEPETISPVGGDTINGHWCSRVSSYSLNICLLMATQLIGSSHGAGVIITSFLSLSSNCFKKSWHKLEDKLGIPIREVTNQITTKNLMKETEDEVPTGGYKPVDVSGDGGWQSGGRSFNSLSGHTMLIGKKTNKVIAYQVYGKQCAKCDVAAKLDRPPPAHECSRNYTGSSKGMESTGLLKCIIDLHTKFGVYIRKFVIDDDTTTKAYAKHSYKEKIKENLMTRDDWPTSESGKTRKTDYGKLPLSHPEIEFVADPNHRIQTFGLALWKLLGEGKLATEMTLVDCYRIKRNFAFWLHTNCRMSRQHFERTAPAVLLHHFNDHSCCDKAWCVYVSKGREFALKKGKYRCMKLHESLYKQLHGILVKFTTSFHLDEMHHCFSSQKNEALNRAIMRFAPKSSCFSKTKSLHTRVALAVGINSIGHLAYYERVWASIGMEMNEHCCIILRKLDRRSYMAGKRSQTAKVKKNRAASKQEKWHREANKQRFDELEGKVYKSGVAVIQDEHNGIPSRTKKFKLCCCGRSDHQRTSHKSCPINKANIDIANDNEKKIATLHHGLSLPVDVGGIEMSTFSLSETSQLNESAQWDQLNFAPNTDLGKSELE